MAKLKRLTARKIRNRGHVPIRYRAADAVHHGYVAKRGRKFLHLVLIGRGRMRVPLAEERYITELAS